MRAVQEVDATGRESQARPVSPFGEEVGRVVGRVLSENSSDEESCCYKGERAAEEGEGGEVAERVRTKIDMRVAVEQTHKDDKIQRVL